MKVTKNKWIIYFGALISILFLILFFANVFIDGYVEKKIVNQLNNNPGSLYKLSYDKLNINIYTGSVTVKGLNIEPAENLQQKLSNDSVKKFINTKIKSFKIKNINLIQFLKNNKIQISAIVIKDMMIDYYFKKGPQEAKNKKTLALHNIFSNQFQGAKIKAVKISNSTVRFTDTENMDQPIFEIDSVSLQINDIKLDKETLKHAIPIKFKDVKINTGQFSLNSSEFYAVKTKGVHFSQPDSSIIINGFELIPKFSKEEFNKRIKYNDDWFSVKTKNIKLNHIHLGLLEQQSKLFLHSILIEEPKIEIYRDKRLPDAPFKYKALVSGVIKKIPLDIKIDTIQIINARLAYEEQLKASDQPGLVYFDPMNLTILNLTNIPEEIKTKSNLEIDIKGKLMGQSFINAHMMFPLDRNDEYFTLSGNLDPISADAFNPFVKNGLNVNINDGKIHKTSFEITANNDASAGSLIMVYENLQVTVMKSKNQSKKSGFISWIANEVIREDNLESHHKYKIGTIGFERRKDRFIVNYIWQSFKSGIISIVAPIADKNKKKEKQATKEEKKNDRKNEKANRKKSNDY